MDAGYEFDLPRELIAQDPPPERGGSRLLVCERFGAVGQVVPFRSLPGYLREGDLLVVNDSRVLPARLWTRRQDTGGEVEILLVRPDDQCPGGWLAMARPARRLRPGQILVVCGDDDQTDVRLEVTSRLEVISRLEGGEVVVRAIDGGDLTEVAERHGMVPLPPYIRRDRRATDHRARHANDRVRYQTVYAQGRQPGAASVAAPTAGLHFTDELLAELNARGIERAHVTLHVGPGTFQPPSAEQIARRRLHPEAFHLPAATRRAIAGCRARGGRVVAVGTTTLRVLASVATIELPAKVTPETRWPVRSGPPDDPVLWAEAVGTEAGWRLHGTTRLFLAPPDRIAAVDALITNFHLPGSSLLMLVAAFGGQDLWRRAYARAIAERLRFYSYGDAMLLLPGEGNPS